MKSLILSALVLLGAGFASAQTSFRIASVQAFPGYLEVTYDQDVVSPATDLLFVIDDSGSMYAHQKNLADFAEQFVQSFVNSPALDLQIGVITTSFRDARRGELIRAGGHAYIHRQTPNAAQALKTNLLVGTNGDADEKPFATLVEAVSDAKRAGANAGFFRPGAALKVILFTDAEDQSTESPDDALAALQRVTSTLSVEAFVATTANACSMDEPRNPDRILDLVTRAGGQSFPICQSDLGPALTSILAPGKGVVGIEIPLPLAPDIATIAVSYGSQTLHGGAARTGWLLDEDRQVIQIGSRVVWSAQPAGTRLKVRYVPLDWR